MIQSKNRTARSDKHEAALMLDREMIVIGGEYYKKITKGGKTKKR
jgi:hypothetical protein